MRVGIIGLGARIATLVPEFLRTNPTLEFIAVADLRRTNGRTDGAWSNAKTL